MKFYLGTHRPHWLKLTDVPLFVSRRWLANRKTLPVARGPWALDSGGFTELSLHGEWRTSARQYAEEIRRYKAEIGNLVWAAPQDWMCEPFMVERTERSVFRHQLTTVNNFLELRDLGVPVIPVLQGWTLTDYLLCIDLYASNGVNLSLEHTVGLGSVCRFLVPSRKEVFA